MPNAPTKISALLLSNLATFLLAFTLGITACLLFLHSNAPQPPRPTDPPTNTASTLDRPPQPNTAVAAAVQQIKSIFEESNKTIAAIPPGAEKLNLTLSAISRSTKQLRTIDTSNCPSDFQLACLAYCQARESYLASMPKVGVPLLLGLGLHVLAGERDAGITKASDAVDARITHIQDTMHDLELVALRHGVKL